jgi:hypothetical protein
LVASFLGSIAHPLTDDRKGREIGKTENGEHLYIGVAPLHPEIPEKVTREPANFGGQLPDLRRRACGRRRGLGPCS